MGQEKNRQKMVGEAEKEEGWDRDRKGGGKEDSQKQRLKDLDRRIMVQ